ncbi:hypothetical protein HWV62_35526 [Athelia sp. TMB]|nr:hypothetical protein HWV62_13148 [Athelia sp. TMB]KAF7981058.1 hypothetical protein HWV62_35526 [Athelia sp. TMB]
METKSPQSPGSKDRSAALQLRIRELELARAEIDLSLKRARRELGELNNLKTPVYSLPNEVLALIFEAGHYSEPHIGKYPARVDETQVTRRWREIALSDARLWTHIYMENGHKLHLERAAEYLRRSKAAPLKVIIEIGGRTKDEEEVRAMYNLVGPYLRRWESFYVKSDWAKGLSVFLQDLHSNTIPALLRTLEVYHREHRSALSMDWSGKLFSAAPLLSSVALRGVTLEHLQLPLQSVKTLHLESRYHPEDMISRRLFCDVLKNSSALTSLTLGGDVIDETFADTTVDLPSLRSLQLRAAEVGLTIPATLIAIRAPILETIVLETVIEEDLQPFFGYLEGSTTTKFPLLRSLTLCQDDDHNFTTATWMQIMRAFPTITDFIFSYHSLEDFLLTLQSSIHPSEKVSDADSALWPALQSLTLSDFKLSAGADVRPVHLLSAIKKRIEMGSPISHLRLSRPIIRQLDNLNHWVPLCMLVPQTHQFTLYPKDSLQLITWRSGISKKDPKPM